MPTILRTSASTRHVVDRKALIELRAGTAIASIDAQRGGRVASIRIGRRELLVGPPDDRNAGLRWGCYLMAPWAGRLADGRVRFHGATHQLRRTHGRHAIHGLVWSVPWAIRAATRSAAELGVGLDRDGWPYGGEVRQTFLLADDRLTIEASVIAGRLAMPAALGWHPWFRRDALGDDVALTIDAPTLLERRRMLPTGSEVPVAGRTDLRHGPRLGRRRLDDAYTGARARMLLRGSDLELRIDASPECETVVVYTPWNAVCVEPQTAWPNALGLGDAAAQGAGRRDLEPGATLTARMTIGWA